MSHVSSVRYPVKVHSSIPHFSRPPSENIRYPHRDSRKSYTCSILAAYTKKKQTGKKPLCDTGRCEMTTRRHDRVTIVFWKIDE